MMETGQVTKAALIMNEKDNALSGRYNEGYCNVEHYKVNHNSAKYYRYVVMTVLAILLYGFLLCSFSVNVKAAGFDYNSWLTAEKAKYPDGKYWNHVGMTSDNSNGYTSSPCTLHGTSGVDHVYGTGGCTCNHFADPKADSVKATYPAVWHYSASQCMGFANKLGYDMFGSTIWSRITGASDSNYAANIKVGDIVRINGHSTFVIAKTDKKITVAECNYVQRSSGQGCLIAWGRVIDLGSVTIEYYDRAQNYSKVMAGTTTPATTEQPTIADDKSGEKTTQEKTTSDSSTEGKITNEAGELFTGWREAEDGEHYQYVKKGVILTSEWVTVKKKKYYLDKSGYRVTGLYTIDKKKYYFNGSGVLQKHKWITVGKKTYYIGGSGHALKSQWLYKGKYLVYVKSNCAMAKSELEKISGTTYYFNSKGRRSAGFKKCKKKYYYCNSYGIILKKQWITKGKKKYYVDKSGVRVQNKMVKISGVHYYFDKKGVLQKNKEIEYEGKIYKAGTDGRLTYVSDVEATTEEASSEAVSLNAISSEGTATP